MKAIIKLRKIFIMVIVIIINNKCKGIFTLIFNISIESMKYGTECFLK